MCEKDKQTAESIARAFEMLPQEKREYLIGYADGVAAMAAKKQEEEKACLAAEERPSEDSPDEPEQDAKQRSQKTSTFGIFPLLFGRFFLPAFFRLLLLFLKMSANGMKLTGTNIILFNGRAKVTIIIAI